MPPVPRLTFKQVARVLRDNEFDLDHVRGSHHYYRDADGQLVTVPQHGNRVIPVGTMRSTMKQSALPNSAWSRS